MHAFLSAAVGKLLHSGRSLSSERANAASSTFCTSAEAGFGEMAITDVSICIYSS
jgi:hypothetical protein